MVCAADPGAVPRGALETVYLGGGTPSLLPPDALTTLVTSLLDAFGATSSRDAVEVTAEANPEDLTPELAGVWRRVGINRVSLGAQSFDDRVLTWMHRSHDATRIATAVRTLRDAGIDNISLDLIFALPAERQSQLQVPLPVALELGRQGEDQVERDVVDPGVPERPHRRGNARRVVGAMHPRQNTVIE